MIDWALYLAFLVAVTLLVVTPGPDMVFIIAVGARGGPWHGFAAALGVAAGLSAHTAAAVLGLSALFTALPPLYHALRWLGAAYLLYLAYTAWRDRNEPVVPVATAPLGRATTFRKALVVNVLNPKVILFSVAFLPQFVNPALGKVWVSVPRARRDVRACGPRHRRADRVRRRALGADAPTQQACREGAQRLRRVGVRWSRCKADVGERVTMVARRLVGTLGRRRGMGHGRTTLLNESCRE